MIREWTAADGKASDRVAVFMKMFEVASGMVQVSIEYTHKKYQKLMESGIVKIYIAETDEQIIQGAIGFMLSGDLHDGKLVGIETFWFVDPSYRGIGKELFNTFEKEAKELGCEKLAMIHMVDSYPDTLKAFYERQGYKLLELHYIKEI